MSGGGHRAAVALVAAALACGGCNGPAGAPPPPPRPLAEAAPPACGPIGVVGDLQQTLWLERLFLFREGNEAAGFVGPFAASRKGLAFVSGHAYERFVERRRTYIVSGGGGGPRVRLLDAGRRRHEDLWAGESPRPFHYLLVEAAPAGLVVSVRGFAKGERGARLLDRFELPFAE